MDCPTIINDELTYRPRPQSATQHCPPSSTLSWAAATQWPCTPAPRARTPTPPRSGWSYHWWRAAPAPGGTATVSPCCWLPQWFDTRIWWRYLLTLYVIYWLYIFYQPALVRSLNIFQLKCVGGTCSVISHGESELNSTMTIVECHWFYHICKIWPVIPYDEWRPSGQGNGSALGIYLHPEDGVLCSPEHWAVHVDGGAPRGGDVGGHVADGRRPLRRDEAGKGWDHWEAEEGLYGGHCHFGKMYVGSISH